MSTARTYHAEAITLKATPFAERDKLLVLYTRHHGKLRVLAKGVRRTTSRMAGHVDLFSHAAIFLVHGRTFDSITQGQALERFPLLHEDLWRFSLACYGAELVDRFTEDVGLPSPGLFEALLRVLRGLGDGALDPALVVRAFEIELLGLVGYRPQLHRCVGCDALIKPEANAFSYADGGVLCPACGVRSATAVPISVEALRILRNLQTRPEAIIGQVRVGEETLDQAEHLIIGYIQYLLDVRIRSVGFIDVLRRLRSARERSVVVG